MFSPGFQFVSNLADYKGYMMLARKTNGSILYYVVDDLFNSMWNAKNRRISAKNSQEIVDIEDENIQNFFEASTKKMCTLVHDSKKKVYRASVPAIGGTQKCLGHRKLSRCCFKSTKIAQPLHIVPPIQRLPYAVSNISR